MKFGCKNSLFSQSCVIYTLKCCKSLWEVDLFGGGSWSTIWDSASLVNVFINT